MSFEMYVFNFVDYTNSTNWLY